jgi:hypothetical protein
MPRRRAAVATRDPAGSASGPTGSAADHQGGRDKALPTPTR